MSDIDPAVRAALDGHDVAFEILECDPEAADTAAFCERYGIAPEDSANAIVVMAKSDPPRFACCVVLATTRLDVNGAVRRRFEVRKASFAPAEVTTAMTGMLIGGVTPIGLPADVPVWIDAAVMERPNVVIGGGNRSSKLRLAPDVLAAVSGAVVIEGLAT